MSDTKDRVVEIAERMARTGGYNGFSFREIAAEIGIKSSSVHHHFPTKELLAVEVARRYTDRFLEGLGEPFPEGSTVAGQLEKYCDGFRASFEAMGRTCLCGMFSNEAYLLPESVRQEIYRFVELNLEWLRGVLSMGQAAEVADAEIESQARFVYAALEGAIGLAALRNDAGWISGVSSQLIQRLA